MKLLQVFNRYRERGGEEKSAQRIYEHAGEFCEIEKLWWDSRDWDLPGGPGKVEQLRKMFYNPESAGELRKKIGECRPDALLCHNLYPVGSPAVYHVAMETGLPVIQYVHNFRPFSVGGSLWTGERVAEKSLGGNYWEEVKNGSWQDSKVKSALFALLLKRLHASGWLDAVKKWVCISDFMREQFLRTGLEEERVVSLRHSWDAGEEPGEWSDEGYYLFLSRLVPEKGVGVLLRAWRQLELQLGPRTPLLRIGGVGSCESEVLEAAEQSDKIDYVGFVDGERKRELIGNCRAMLAPSIWWEPLGLVTYEAYDAGKPMLAASSGGLTETIEHGETGLLYEANNPGALVEAVQTVEAMAIEDRQRMGQRGRAKLVSEFSPELWKKRFFQILKESVEK